MNVVEALFVTLGLNKTDFDKGNKEVQDGLKKTGDEAEKLRKRHEAEAKKSAEAFKTVSNAVMGITAAIVSAVAGGEFLSFLTKNDTAAMNLARNIGATTEQASTLEGVFRRLGSSTADAESFLRTVNRIQEEIKLTGTSAALQPFALAGLDIAAFRKATPQGAMDLLADASAKMNPRDAQFYLQNAGMSESQINIILRGRAAVDAMFESQKRLNVVTKEDGEIGQKRQTAWADLGEVFEGTGRKIANFFTPVLVSALNALRDFILWTQDHIPAAVGILGTLGSALLLLKGYSIASMATAFSGNIGIMMTAVGGLIGKLGILGLTFTAAYEIGSAISSFFGLDDILSGDQGMPFDLQAGTASEGRMSILTGGKRGGGSGSLGSRNNNPGNLHFANQTGASVGSGGFAAFKSVTEGLAALENDLTLKAHRGMTLAQMIAMYAPASDHNNVPAYIADISKRTGIGANSVPNVNDPATMQAMMMAWASHEGNPVDLASINAGMGLASSRGRGVNAPNISVANVNMTTSASTLTGAGHDFHKGMSLFATAQQANTGMQ